MDGRRCRPAFVSTACHVRGAPRRARVRPRPERAVVGRGRWRGWPARASRSSARGRPTPYGRRLARAVRARPGRGRRAASSRGSRSASTPPPTRARSTPERRPIGVLGGGHARFFPRRNARLAERMLRGRRRRALAVRTPDAPALPAQFLARNAHRRGLADAVRGRRGAGRSGALNTAAWAADRANPRAGGSGRRRPRAASQGCHALIRDGATLARTPATCSRRWACCRRSGPNAAKPRLARRARIRSSDAVVRAARGGRNGASTSSRTRCGRRAGAILAALSRRWNSTARSNRGRAIGMRSRGGEDDAPCTFA